MVAVTARTAAGLQVEAQASLDTREHERRTDGARPKVGRLAREGRAACVVALQEDDAVLEQSSVR